ncbi:MAG: PQQ-like beta-propeller repeat protein [Planctomycetota bacterium]|nr:PQQ-like beta-propeller repeat protein [Planctomycetota bacterium]MDA1139109.1 PQQ-like beta-propeller repeat protein [Planctomycetota bacterium]
MNDFVLLLLTIVPATLFAGDWPQILGPERNGIAQGEALMSEWPAQGPKILWKRDVGEGYAGIAVSQSKAVLFHRVDGKEVVECMDAATGKVMWDISFPVAYSGGLSSDSGPRCTPLIYKNQVVVFGIDGSLHCISFKDGQIRWSRHVGQDYKSPESYFGHGSTPVAHGDTVLLNPGGRPDAGLIAVSLKDGETVWKTGSEKASYSSPTSVELFGKQHVVFLTRLNLVSINPATGAEYFRFPFGSMGPTVNAATPAVHENHVFVTASYSLGAMCVKVGETGSSVLWENNEMASQFTTPVYKDGLLYGIDGREDVGQARLICMEMLTGKVKWAKRGFGKAALILAGDRLLIMKTNGTLVLAEASPEAYKELTSNRVLGSATFALPALAEGRIYVRDTRTLKCLEVGKTNH